MRVNADSACGPPVARHLLAQSCIERMREPDTRFLQLLPDDRVFTATEAASIFTFEHKARIPGGM
jgi:hypothetical protein